MHFHTSKAAVITLATLFACPAAYAYTPERAGFTIEFDGLVSDLNILSATVMPGETLRIITEGYAAGENLSPDTNAWTWQAPSTPGHSRVTFEKNGETITLNIFILTPFENGVQKNLNGYKIGTYAKRPFKGLENYKAPRGFIALDENLSNTKISPHFTLGQFICKQQPGHNPTYLLIQPETLVKLEYLLDNANTKGWNADSFHVMSGYRTPWYNASIGNKTTSSRHLFGGAADIWLDGDGDGKMDDLNGDGRVNKDDARELAKLANTLAAKGGRNWPAGGVGVYGSNSAHGPFVHIDARGYKARWGH